MRILLLTVLGATLAAGPGHAAPSASSGADVFSGECGDCHSVSPKGINRKGPSLFRVIGRKPGSVPGFAYSDGMKGLAAPWTPETLEAYLRDPKAVVPGGKMKFKGLAKADERQDVIAFLASRN